MDQPARETADSDEAIPARPWYSLQSVAALEGLRTEPAGLSDAEAPRGLQTRGPNRLPQGPRRGPLVRLLVQFHNLLIYVLLAAPILAAAIGHGVDAAVIFAVVLINAAIGFVQEGNAEKALDAVRRMIDPQASVIRAGSRLTIAAESVVPGDIVLLEAGDRVPADLRLIKARCRDITFGDVESGLTLLGLVGLIDPPRPEAVTAVANARPPASGSR